MNIVHFNNGMNMTFTIHNNNLDLRSLFHYEIIDMLYAVNKEDIINNCKIEVSKEARYEGENGNAIMKIIFHHLFKDCGVPQYHLNLNLDLENKGQLMIYKSSLCNDSIIPLSLSNGRTPLRPSKAFPIIKMDMVITFITTNSASFLVSLEYGDTTSSPTNEEHQQKMVSTVFKKLFNRLKGFIEKM
jgi:hypothetical protein